LELLAEGARSFRMPDGRYGISWGNQPLVEKRSEQDAADFSSAEHG
jgi:hypothetical protein